jgi:AAA family ATP:ADP antiporter
MRYLESALGVKQEEMAPAVLLFLYLFFAIGCYIMAQAAGDALFLSAFPRYLPHVIMATAVAVGLFTSVYIRLSHRVGFEQVVVGSLLFFAAVFTMFWWLTRAGGEWVYPLLYVWVYTVGALAPTMGWTLANHSLTTREARRVFGFIGAGAVLGAPCAGFLTVALTRRAGLKPETLLLVIAAGFVCCAQCVRTLFRRRRARLAEFGWQNSPASGTPKTLLQVWSVVRASRYLLLITALITLGCCATTVVGYQFKLIARQAYQGDKAGLAAFFGAFNGYVGMASFVLQMLLTGRLLRSLGIRVTLFVMPVVFLGGSLGVLFVPLLASAMVLRGSQGLLRYSVDKSTTELLYLPVAPPSVKGQVKSFIDGFVWRIADGIGGLALLLFATLNFSPGEMSLLNFVFLGGWIAVAYGVRHEYLTVLRSAIEHRKLDPETTAANVLDATTVEMLAQSLAREGEQQTLYGLSLFELGREPAWHPALKKLLDHPSAAVRQRALRLLGETKQHGLEGQVERMLADESLDVRSEALRYLVNHEHKDPVLLLRTVRDVPEHCLQSAVASYLAQSDDPDWLRTSRHILEQMISQDGPGGSLSRREAARALGDMPGRRELHSQLSTLLQDCDNAVVEQALLSAGRLQIQDLLPTIVEGLGQSTRLGATRQALFQYGDTAVETLRERLNNAAVPLPTRRRIPAILASIGTTSAAQALSISLLQSDPETRYGVIKATNRIRARHPDRIATSDEISRMLDYELLAYYRSFQILAALEDSNGAHSSDAVKHNGLATQAMRERMRQEFERVFRLLALIYPPADMHNAYLSLTSHRPQLQANALEVLEHLLPSDLYRRVAGVADPEITQERRLGMARMLSQAEVSSPSEALRTLIHSGDSWLCSCALHAVGMARLSGMLPDLDELGPQEPMLAETWTWANKRLTGHHTANGGDMLSLLEKVDLLRHTRLFEATPTHSLARVAAVASELQWAAQQVVYRENSVAESIFFVLEGEVELLRAGKVLSRGGPHQVLGGLAALSGGSHAESAIVSQPTRALCVGRDEFFDAMADDFGVTQGIVKALAGMAIGAA